jgi:hypothetical protein
LRVRGAGVVDCGLPVASIAEADETGRRQCEGMRVQGRRCGWLARYVRRMCRSLSMGRVVVFVFLFLMTSFSFILVLLTLLLRRALISGKDAIGVVRVSAGRTARFEWR